MREFESGATRDDDETKPDYEGYLSEYALPEYAAYMLKHQKQADGETRPSDNWKKGLPIKEYLKSLWRHHITLWVEFKKPHGNREIIIEACCAIMFNIQGFLHEFIKPKPHPTGGFLPVEQEDIR